jgi:hypothetical protein
MAVRPFAFGVRLREKDRSVRIRQNERDPRRYTVETTRAGRPKRTREHASLASAFRDAASSWRSRLH